jgi:peptidoglycan/xylan/chitin deacetylase (PgdA/CDA1 family)
MKLFAVAAALLALVTPAAAPAQPGFAWPEGRQAAIVLTYDDAAPSQLVNAVPALDEAGLKATFFLNARFGPESVAQWRAVAANGHELGNHTLFHPCPKGRFAMEKQYESETYSMKGMLAEIAAMNTLLAAIDGKAGRTMGIPCGIPLAGGQDYIAPLRASGMIRYVRNRIDGGGIPWADPRTLDPFNVPCVSFPTSATAADYIAWVEQVRRAGGLGVIVFHGVGGDWLSVTNEAHRGLLAYLKAHQQEIWVAPFQTVMDQVMAARGK